MKYYLTMNYEVHLWWSYKCHTRYSHCEVIDEALPSSGSLQKVVHPSLEEGPSAAMDGHWRVEYRAADMGPYRCFSHTPGVWDISGSGRAVVVGDRCFWVKIYGI